MMGHVRKKLLFSGTFPDKFRIFSVIFFFCTLLPALCLLPGTAAGEMDLADEPMLAKTKPAPANIMIVLDDSGSMTFEILIQGQYDGRHPNSRFSPADRWGFCYIFDYLGDNGYEYDDSKDRWADIDNRRYMLEEYRTYWKSQYSGVNVMYYNPAFTYSPWPNYPGQTFSNADTETPAPDPIKTGTTNLNLDATSYSLVMETSTNLLVKHAHYFAVDDGGEVWLVVLDGGVNRILYYKVTGFDGAGLEQKVTKVRLETNLNLVPDEVEPQRATCADEDNFCTYAEERQNFANWFTYHRRRAYVAKYAIAQVINRLQGVRVGILGINGTILVPLKPLGVWKDNVYYDQRDELLAELYAYDSDGGTPLREGLNSVGQYYKNNSITLEHWDDDDIDPVDGEDPPYASEADGGACQQSFTIVMTDGFYSYSQSPAVGDADSDNNTDWDGGFYDDDKPYTLADTLADVAMYYYENDLNTSLPNMVNDPVLLNPNAIDTARHQHMVTFGVAFGVTGNLTPTDYNNDPASPDFLKDSGGNYPTWPEGEGSPTRIPARSKGTIDDLFHATVNGRGNFLTARNPRELADSLLALMDNIISRLGSAAAVSINGDSLYSQVSDDVIMFQASYNTNDWSGDVKAYSVDSLTGFLVERPEWSAADSLTAMNWESRNILTYNGSDGAEFDPAESSIDWETVLGSDYANIINYVSGQNDISGFRVRSSLLGDIVHSSPVFENDVVYVGANDGMLHAFQITAAAGVVSGVEKFAYVPSFVYQNLENLTQTPLEHKYFVDLTPTIATGYELLGGDEIDQTILVGGLGKGGKGYFALDITDPNSMNTDKVLWEFPDDDTADDHAPDMGYSFSRPVVVQTNSQNADEAWVVITGNGYDSPNGKAILFILNPQTGGVTRKISTNEATGNGLSTPVAVDVNYDRRVDFVYAGDLMGNMWKFDLTGNDAAQWSVAYYEDTNNQPLFQAIGPTGAPQPITTKPEVMFHPKQHEMRSHGLMVLFGTGKLMGESDFSDNNRQSVYGIWDYGDRAWWPGTWGGYSRDDNGEFIGAFNRPELSKYDGQNITLLEQTATAYTVDVRMASGDVVEYDIRVMSGNEPNWYTEEDPDQGPPPSLPDIAEEDDGDITVHAGWFWDLPLTGERVISDVLLRDGRLVVIPFTPNENRCGDGGSSFLMEIDAVSGGHSGAIIFDINNDGVINAEDMVTIGKDEENNDIKKIPDGLKLAGNVQAPAILILDEEIEVKYLSSSSGAVHMVKEKAVRLGVTYWKELNK